jgi:hypothetical protein
VSPNSWSLPNIQHIFYRISDIFAENRILKTFLRKKIRFLMQGQTKSMYFHEILGLVRQKMVDKLFIQTDQNLPKNVFLPTTDKYSAVFTEYSVGHYSAEWIVGRSLESAILGLEPERVFWLFSN